MKQKGPYFFSALSQALLLHAFLLGLLVWQGASSLWSENTDIPARADTAPVPSEPVRAHAVDPKALATELKRLQDEDLARKSREAERLQRLQQQAEALAQKRKTEEARLQAVQKAQAEAEKHALAQQALLRKQQEAEEKRLRALAQQREVAQMQAKRAQEQALAQQLAADAAQLAADADRLRAARQAKRAALMQQYTSALRQKVGQHWLGQGTWQGLETKLWVRLAPGGSVLEVRVLRSSGNMALDRSARLAIYKASPLPVPSDPELFTAFQEFQFTFKPDEFTRASAMG